MIDVPGEPIEDDSRFNHFDFRDFCFPSDSLTIAAMRRAHPAMFDIGLNAGLGDPQPIFFLNAASKGHAQDMIGEMLFSERLLALWAYADARGIEPPNLSREEAIDTLTPLYVRYGLASGAHHAEQLIRDIEKQGKERGTPRQK